MKTGSQQKFWKSVRKQRKSTRHFYDGLTKAAAILFPKEMWAKHLDKFRPIACPTTMKKKGAYSILMAVEKAKEWDIPLFAPQFGLEKKQSVRPRGQTPSIESNEGTRSRQTAPGMDTKTLGTTQFTNEARTPRVENTQNDKGTPARGLPQGAPYSPTLLVDIVVEKAKNSASNWTNGISQVCGICGRHCGIGNITKSSGANDFGPHRRFQRNGP